MTQPQRIEQPDPLIDDVRRIRAKLDKKYGNDWKGYADHLRKTAANLQGKFAGSAEGLKGKKEGPH
jgi:hypothetical protein